MTTTTAIRIDHLVRAHSFAARLSPGFDTLAVKLARIRRMVDAGGCRIGAAS